jgi:hypothetical protein
MNASNSGAMSTSEGKRSDEFVQVRDRFRPEDFQWRMTISAGAE